MSQHTCKWCGTSYGTPNLLGAADDPYLGYCCAKCANEAKAAQREQEAARQQEREARKQRLAEIEEEGGFRAKLLNFWRFIKWTFWIVVILSILLALLI